MWDQLDPPTIDNEAASAEHDEAAAPEETLAEQCGLTDESKLASVYASHYLLPLFEPPLGLSIPVDHRLRNILPAEFCLRHHIVPLAAMDQSIEVAIASPSALLLADEIRQLTGRQMRPLFARATVVRKACQSLFGDLSTPTESPEQPCPATQPYQPSAWSPTARVATPMDLTAYDLTDEERACWQRHLVADSGLTIHCGRRGIEKQPLARLWGAWTSQTHGLPVCRWNATRQTHWNESPGVVVVPDLGCRMSAEFCLHAVLQGHRAFAVVHARDPVSAILRLRAFGQIGHFLAEQIRLVIHQNGPSRSDCRSIEIDEVRRDALATETSTKRLNELFPPNGTFLCGH